MPPDSYSNLGPAPAVAIAGEHSPDGVINPRQPRWVMATATASTSSPSTATSGQGADDNYAATGQSGEHPMDSPDSPDRGGGYPSPSFSPCRGEGGSHQWLDSGVSALSGVSGVRCGLKRAVTRCPVRPLSGASFCMSDHPRHRQEVVSPCSHVASCLGNLLLGVIEAKTAGTTLSSIKGQTSAYAEQPWRASPEAATLKSRMRLARPLDRAGMWPAQIVAAENLEARIGYGHPRGLTPRPESAKRTCVPATPQWQIGIATRQGDAISQTCCQSGHEVSGLLPDPHCLRRTPLLPGVRENPPQPFCGAPMTPCLSAPTSPTPCLS
jgi:hypothetical protein